LGERVFVQAYWASPAPNDQFSPPTSTRLMNTSCGRRPGFFPKPFGDAGKQCLLLRDRVRVFDT
jgi:hypothetical protein